METDKRAVETQEKVQRFVLLAVEGDAAPIEAEKSLHELEELLETAGAVSVGRIIQKLDSPHPKTYLGTGKIAEVKEKIAETGADGVITDDELTPVQLKALTDQLGVKVVDRTLLILDIFSQRAVTKEGMMQVELAQLNYRLTRLTGLGTELSRQGAAVGTHTRGAGETKLELDRRHSRRRIDMLNRQLKDMEQQRGLLRSQRTENEIPVLALVGYTNAGKSTLFNRFTNAGVLEEDKLFATLDTTTRKILLPSGREALLTDTVGFIHKLPHQLVKAFRATLEEVVYADILLHVVDASDEKAQLNMTVTTKAMEDLGAGDKPVVTLLNKQDKAGASEMAVHVPYASEEILKISAFSDEDRHAVLEAVDRILDAQQMEISVLLPYSEGRLHDMIRRKGQILEEEFREDGIFLRVRTKKKYASMVGAFQVQA